MKGRTKRRRRGRGGEGKRKKMKRKGRKRRMRRRGESRFASSERAVVSLLERLGLHLCLLSCKAGENWTCVCVGGGGVRVCMHAPCVIAVCL